jgi:putative transposase
MSKRSSETNHQTRQLPPALRNQFPGSGYATQESPPITNATTLNDRQTPSAPSTRTTSLWKRSDQPSTSNVGPSQPFWDASTKDTSTHWSFSTETGSAALDWSWSNSSSIKQTQNCWWSTKSTALRPVPKAMERHPGKSSQRTCSRWLTSLSHATMECARLQTAERENERESQNLKYTEKILNKSKKVNPPLLQEQGSLVKQPPERIIKYRLYPSPQQWTKIKQLFGACTWSYNAAKQLMENKECKGSLEEMRLRILRKGSPALLENPWLGDVPVEAREGAVKDLLSAKKAVDTKVKNGQLRPDQALYFKWQTRKQPSRSVVLRPQNYRRRGVFYPDMLGKEPFRSTEELPDRLEYDSRLQLTWLGHLYLCVPRPLDTRRESQAPAAVAISSQAQQPQHRRRPVVAIDPGVRCFGTTYDGFHCTEWGKGDMGRIYRLGHHLDALQSRIDSDPTVDHHRRWKLRRAWRRMSLMKQNMVRDFHYRFAHWLCSNYSVILWPRYDTRGMVRRGHRRITSKVVRGMMSWCPASFRDRLIGVSRRYSDCSVVLVDEGCTTKTCGGCGTLHNGVGGSKVFTCGSCGFRLGRDLNGARNILLRWLTLSGVHCHQEEREEHVLCSDDRVEAYLLQRQAGAGAVVENPQFCEDSGITQF